MRNFFRVLVFCFLFPLNTAWSQSVVSRGAEAKLLEMFPKSITFSIAKGKENYLFCPDNTCIEFQNGKGTDLINNGLLYLYIFGDYFELEKWRAIPDVQEEINQLLDKKPFVSCKPAAKRFEQCIATKLKKRGLRVYYLRHDEGKQIRNRIF